MKKIKSELLSLRAKIDEIDYRLVELFNERAQIVNHVKNVKDAEIKNAEFHLHIKPEREFNVVSNAVALAKGSSYNSKFFAHTWRGVISASNFIEQDLNLIATCDVSRSSLFEYYAMQKHVDIASVVSAFARIQANESHILAFHQSNVEAFECLKSAKNLTVFAKCASDVFVCGKIASPYFTPPALVLITTETDTVINTKAGIFATSDLSEVTLGGFYPYFS